MRVLLARHGCRRRHCPSVRRGQCGPSENTHPIPLASPCHEHPQRRYWTPNASTRPGAVHVARSASVMSQRLPNERCCEDGLRRRHRHRFVAPLAGIVPGAEAAAPSSVSSSTSTAKLFLHSSPSSRRSAHPQTWLHRRSASKRSSRPTTRPPHRRCAERALLSRSARVPKRGAGPSRTREGPRTRSMLATCRVGHGLRRRGSPH